MDMLANGDVQQRLASLKSLQASGMELESLLQASTTDRSAEVRIAALRQLATGDGFAITQGLLLALNDTHEQVAMEAAQLLKRKGDRSVVRHMEKRIADINDPALRTTLRTITNELHLSARIESDHPYLPLE